MSSDSKGEEVLIGALEECRIQPLPFNIIASKACIILNSQVLSHFLFLPKEIQLEFLLKLE